MHAQEIFQKLHFILLLTRHLPAIVHITKTNKQTNKNNSMLCQKKIQPIFQSYESRVWPWQFFTIKKTIAIEGDNQWWPLKESETFLWSPQKLSDAFWVKYYPCSDHSVIFFCRRKEKCLPFSLCFDTFVLWFVLHFSCPFFVVI